MQRLSFKGNMTVSKAVRNLHEQLYVKLWSYNAKMLLCRLALDSNDLALFGVGFSFSVPTVVDTHVYVYLNKYILYIDTEFAEEVFVLIFKFKAKVKRTVIYS